VSKSGAFKGPETVAEVREGFWVSLGKIFKCGSEDGIIPGLLI
jgi:hypothetical protein